MTTTYRHAAVPVWDSRLRLRCIAIRAETADVKSFLWQPVRPARFVYYPGQFITLKLNIDGKSINRTYTLSSSPLRPFFASITVKRQPGGVVSNYLHDEMRVGQEIEAVGPGGVFSLLQKPPADKYLFLSGGSGITPLLSMSRYLFDSCSPLDVLFIHSARTPADIICADELRTMAAVQPHFQLRFFCDKSDPQQSWSGYVGFLTEEGLSYAVPDLLARTLFCCGPRPYMDNVQHILKRKNFNMENYYEESFTFDTVKKAAKKPQATTRQEGFSIVFQSLGREIRCNADTTVLAAAHQQGIDWPSLCEEGICGTCLATKISGDVLMNDQGGINEVQQKEGGVLLCCSKPRSDLVLA